MLRLALSRRLPAVFRLGRLPYHKSATTQFPLDDHAEASNTSTRVTSLETEVKDLKTEMKESESKISHKFDILTMKIESSQRDLTMKIESGQRELMLMQKEQMATFLSDQQKQFSNFYARCFFGIMSVALLLVGGAWVLPVKENERMEAQIKRRAIIKDGVDKIVGQA